MGRARLHEAGENSKNKRMKAVGSGTALTAKAIASTGLENAMSLLKEM